MKRRWLFLLLPVALAPFVFVSTAVCSCEPSVDTVAGQMKIYQNPDESHLASADENASLGRKAFVGRPILALSQTKMRALDPECKQVGESEVRCEYWNESSLFLSRGRAVTIEADKMGKVTAVAVRSITKVAPHQAW